jgi:hypothetical protein
LEVCGRGVVAMDGVNVVKPPKYSAGKESGSREPVAARGFENGVWPSPGLHCSGDGADLRRGRGSVYDLQALPTRGIGHGTSALESVATGRCRARFVRAQIFVVDKVALLLAPIGQAVVGSPLWPRLSPNTMCAQPADVRQGGTEVRRSVQPKADQRSSASSYLSRGSASAPH